MIKSILFCTDGSEYSSVAGDYAIWLAQKLKARIVALHVTDVRLLEAPLLADLSGAIGAQPYQALLPQLQEMQKQRAGVILNAVADRCRKAGVQCSTLHRTGSVVENIAEEETRTELVVLGQRGEHAQAIGQFLGSSVERVVRRSIKPCLVTPAKFRELRQVLVAYDGSAQSSKSLQVAVELCQTLGLKLSIVTVVSAPPEMGVSNVLEDAVRIARDHGIEPSAETLVGHAEQRILEYVERQQVDLIVMGAYGHTRIREMILGSTTTHVIRKSDVPVLLTR
ncbi:MAG: universal stress protein [Verrucomicrobiia bacterium]|jgi:nucleotide-binding universal stress UspA family protein